MEPKQGSDANITSNSPYRRRNHNKTRWAAKLYEVHNNKDVTFKPVEKDDSSIRKVQIGDLSNIDIKRVRVGPHIHETAGEHRKQFNAVHDVKKAEITIGMRGEERTEYPIVNSFLYSQESNGSHHRHRVWKQDREKMCEEPHYKESVWKSEECPQPRGRSKFSSKSEDSDLGSGQNTSEDEKFIIDLQNMELNRSHAFKRRSKSVPADRGSMGDRKVGTGQLGSRDSPNEHLENKWMVDRELPHNVSSFVSVGHGVMQEYVFVNNDRPKGNGVKVSNRLSSLKSINIDANSEAENDEVSDVAERFGVSEKDFETEAADHEVALGFTEPKFLNAKSVITSRTLQNKRKSLSVPTSPTFAKQPGLIGRFYRRNLIVKNVSGGSSPARSDSPDSVASLASKALLVQIPLIMANGSPDVDGSENENVVLISDSEEGEQTYAAPLINFARYNGHKQLSNGSTTYAMNADVQLKEQGKKIGDQKTANMSKESRPKITWEELEKNRRCSETVVNSFMQDGRRFASLGRGKGTGSPDNEPIRPTARRAALVSTLPESDMSLLSDTIATLQRNNQHVESSPDMKRSKWNFLHFRKDKERSKEQKFEEVLEALKPKEPDLGVALIIRDLNNCTEDGRGSTSSSISLPSPTIDNPKARSRKRQNAVWELFASERTYLIDHLLVLQQVFMEPLQELQCEGYLLSVDLRSIFANLEELCKVSMNFCHTLLNVVEASRSEKFSSANAIVQAFEKFGSVMCPPYQRYCTSYGNSITYREEVKSNEDYAAFIKWCERNPKCQRLKLTDFLVAPIQRLVKYPLLLQKIAQYTAEPNQSSSIENTLHEVQESLQALEGKVSWLSHFQLMQDLQNSISWPAVYDLDTKTALPESLRHALAQQPCRNLIGSPRRQLVLDGTLTVVESNRTTDIYALLFDDMLLFTKPKKGKRKSSEVPSSLKRHSVLKDGTLLSVFRQPVALDRFMVYDVEADQASSLGIKNAFVLVQENRFQQMTSVTMLQASSEESKRNWLTQLASTAAQWMEIHVYGNISPNSPNGQRSCTRSTPFSSQPIRNDSYNDTLSQSNKANYPCEHILERMSNSARSSASDESFSNLTDSSASSHKPDTYSGYPECDICEDDRL
uniref:uncharacterized protein LOC104265935 isoform X2 n=1 Tax=Ciona intestinalis TaxID=7719 RepID=UPI000EF46C7D|nr:uncharacterized protein LOC104265935 isoform X2 [Ciona intestinalis]|eukprot:XP_018668275.2 uncharacterized protein LOC104265935 isoform X2 [Ciona intestinalis]